MPADDDDVERGHRERQARRRLERQDRRDERARRAHAGGADAEGGGVDAAHVGADDQRAVGVVGGGADQRPEVGADEEERRAPA